MVKKPRWEDPEIREYEELDEEDRPVGHGGCRPRFGCRPGFGFGGCFPGGCFPNCSPSCAPSCAPNTPCYPVFHCYPSHHCRPR